MLAAMKTRRLFANSSRRPPPDRPLPVSPMTQSVRKTTHLRLPKSFQIRLASTCRASRLLRRAIQPLVSRKPGSLLIFDLGMAIQVVVDVSPQVVDSHVDRQVADQEGGIDRQALDIERDLDRRDDDGRP